MEIDVERRDEMVVQRRCALGPAGPARFAAGVTRPIALAGAKPQRRHGRRRGNFAA